MLEIIQNRIRERLAATGISARDASLKADLSDSFVKNILSGKTKSPKAENIALLADVLRCDIDYILGRQALPHIDKLPDFAKLPVVGQVEAGVWRESTLYAQSEREISVPQDERFSHLERYVVEVVGNSFDRVAPPGSYAVCVPFDQTAIALRSNLTVVIERSREGGSLKEATLRRTVSTPEGFEFHSHSHNSETDIVREAEPDLRVTGLVVDFVIPVET